MLRWILAVGVTGIALAAASLWWGSEELHRRSAWRLVGAPNHGKDKGPETPAEGIDHALRIPVGPPEAVLDVWVLDPLAPPRGTVLILHGVYDKKRTMVGFGKMLRTSNGLRAVLVDLRGHGHSTGDYLSFGQVESRDLSQVMDFLAARGLLVAPVSVYGPSFGAAVALQTAAVDPRIERVVAVATFGSFEKIVVPYIDHFHPQLAWALPGWWSESVVDRANRIADVDLRANDNLAAIRTAGARVLIMHGEEDEIVGVDQARALYDACGPERCRLVVFPGRNHAESMSGEVLNRETLAWLKGEPADAVGVEGGLTGAGE